MRSTFSVACLVISCVVANAGWYNPPRLWTDLSWWGNSGAQPRPVKDESRAGYWWYPTAPTSSADDTDLWGNRGKIFHVWTAPVANVPKAMPLPRKTPSSGSPCLVILNNILFDYDKSVLKPEGKAEVDKLIAEMKKQAKVIVIIAGHTDDTGSDAYNMALGERRAIAVKNYMIEQGIEAARIVAVSKGESEPVSPNDTPANRKLNRRVEFYVQIVSQ